MEALREESTPKFGDGHVSKLVNINVFTDALVLVKSVSTRCE